MSDKIGKICKRLLAVTVAVLAFAGTVNCLAAEVDRQRTGGWIDVGDSQTAQPTEPPSELPTPAPTEPPTDPPTDPPEFPTGELVSPTDFSETQEQPTGAGEQQHQQPTQAVNNNSAGRATTRARVTTTAASGNSEDVTVAVNFELNGAEGSYDTIYAPIKAHLYVPATPVREGYKFMGWFSDPEFNNAWDFEGTELTKNATLYAKWVPLVYYTVTVDTGITGGVVTVNLQSATEGDQIEISVTPDEGHRIVKNSLTVNGERQKKLVFEMPACDVFISAQFEEGVSGLSGGSSKKLVVLVGAAMLVAATFVVYALLMRHRDDDDDMKPDWQDDSIVVTGITKKDGKIVTVTDDKNPEEPESEEFDE